MTLIDIRSKEVTSIVTAIAVAPTQRERSIDNESGGRDWYILARVTIDDAYGRHHFTLELRVDSLLRLENAEVQRASQRTSCSQIRGVDLFVEDDSSILVMAQ